MIFAVEVLGDGQQYVVEGTHPKTRQPYLWRDGRSPAVVGEAGLTRVTADQVEAFLERVTWLVENLWDGEILAASGLGAGATGSGVFQGNLQAPSLAAVRQALAAIPNDLDYEDWFRVMAMTKAATEGLEA